MDRSTLLSNIPLFESLTPDDLAALSARLEERTFAAGEAIFAQGDPGSTLFLIQEGGVEISVGQGKTRVVLATLFPGQYFGELSLMDGAPRSATAAAAKASTLLALDRDDFKEFIKKDPDAALLIMAEMGERMRQTNELMTRQVSKNVVEEVEEKATLGQRVADRVAAFGGSWTFIGLFGGFMALWMGTNAISAIAWDPMPFILLNLMLSTVAALQAPVIMMSQNRAGEKDKALAENDFQVNLKNEIGIDSLVKGQQEILARLALLERHAGAMSGQLKVQTLPPA